MKKSTAILFVCLIFISIFTGCTNSDEPLVLETSAEEETAIEDPKPDTSAEEAVQDPSDKASDNSVGKIPLIFSHDGAPDDIAAMVYIAKHPDINLLGVVNSYGEQHPSQSQDEWQRFLYEVIDNDDAAFGLGSEKSVDPEQNHFPNDWRTGADNFWNVDLPAASNKYETTAGADLIIELVKNSSEKVTVLLLGGHTDMALALQKDASIKDNIKEVFVMGGAFNQEGNLYEAPGYEHNRVAEWNIYVDPLAAKQVFTSGMAVTVVPLDGSDNFFIREADLDRISGIKDPVLEVLSDLWYKQLNLWGGNEFKIWDIVTTVALTNPDHFKWTIDGIDVIAEPGDTHGQTIALENGSTTTRFASQADFDKVKETVFDVLLSTAQSEENNQTTSTEDQTVEQPDVEAAPLDAIAGRWSGQAIAEDGTEFTITLDLGVCTQLKQTCGTFFIETWGISGDITFTNVVDDKYIFNVSNTEGAPESDEAYEEYLRLINTNEIEYFSRGSYGTSKGTLSRQ
jgi:pyrimidine-specific ribonucleoside hydrolase